MFNRSRSHSLQSRTSTSELSERRFLRKQHEQFTAAYWEASQKSARKLHAEWKAKSEAEKAELKRSLVQEGA